MTAPRIGTTWPGAGPHADHTITLVETWPTTIDGTTVTFADDGKVILTGGQITAGRVSCSCGDQWDVGGFPAEAWS